MTSSYGNIFRVTGHLCGEFTGHREFPTQRPVALMFSMICINGWVTNGEAGDLRRHRAHYDITVMYLRKPVGSGFGSMTRPVTRSFDVFFDLRLNKRLSKQSWGWWFETLECPWRHCNVYNYHHVFEENTAGISIPIIYLNYIICKINISKYAVTELKSKWCCQYWFDFQVPYELNGKIKQIL